MKTSPNVWEREEKKVRKAAKLKKHEHLLMYSRNLPNSSYTPLMF